MQQRQIKLQAFQSQSEGSSSQQGQHLSQRQERPNLPKRICMKKFTLNALNIFYKSCPKSKVQLFEEIQRSYFDNIPEEMWDKKVRNNLKRRYDDTLNVFRSINLIKIKGKIVEIMGQKNRLKQQLRNEEAQVDQKQLTLEDKRQNLKELREVKAGLVEHFKRKLEPKTLKQKKIHLQSIYLTLETQSWNTMQHSLTRRETEHQMIFKGKFLDYGPLDRLITYVCPQKKEESTQTIKM